MGENLKTRTKIQPKLTSKINNNSQTDGDKHRLKAPNKVRKLFSLLFFFTERNC